jgi:hypothetical protein
MATMADVLGWIGAALLLSAYALLSFRKLSPQGLVYQGMNVVGSSLLAVNTGYHRAFPSTAVNVVWIFIAIAALLHANKKTAQAQSSN